MYIQLSEPPFRKLKMNNPKILTLLSDFGLSDVYVGVMKGAISQINSSLTVVDLTHQIPPQNIIAARFCLANAIPYFPIGTVHVAVVDPGVGSNRRAIALQTPIGFLVGPDNGLFSSIVAQTERIIAIELTNPNYWLTPTPSSTFHGRDIFAPVGAHLASGTPITSLGKNINPNTLVQLPLSDCRSTDNRIEGCIQYIDRFGNLITNIPNHYLSNKNWYAQVAGEKINRGQTYANSSQGEAIALIGSHGYVEIAVNGGSAQSLLQLNWEDKIQLIVTS